MAPTDPLPAGRWRPKLTAASLELLVLSALEGSPTHGYALAQRLRAAAGRAPAFDPATLYPLLGRLTKEGLLCATRQVGARVRVRYELTPEGTARLVQLGAAWQAQVARIQAVALPALRRAARTNPRPTGAATPRGQGR